VSTAAEVAQVRDQLVALGLTRQQVAAVLGVSRRALSGWASGEIRPTLEHVARLRALVAAAEAIADRHPGQVRERLLLPDTREPIWAAAAEALAEGRLRPLERQGTVRPESIR
jgi:transcriptional regulator with XRE-family HTH domain